MLRTNRQTDKHTDSKILSMPTDRVVMGNDCVSFTELGFLRISDGREPGTINRNKTVEEIKENRVGLQITKKWK